MLGAAARNDGAFCELQRLPSLDKGLPAQATIQPASDDTCGLKRLSIGSILGEPTPPGRPPRENGVDMTAISHRGHLLDKFAPILLNTTGDAVPPALGPEFDVDASLAMAGWLDVHTREQLLLSLSEKRIGGSPFHN
jgi:hypothetical protein